MKKKLTLKERVDTLQQKLFLLETLYDLLREKGVYTKEEYDKCLQDRISKLKSQIASR